LFARRFPEIHADAHAIAADGNVIAHLIADFIADANVIAGPGALDAL
jgi:hypothetical protein